MSASVSTVERGIGNVFADLDHPEADTHLLEADLVSRIDTIIRQRGITQTEAARLLGLTQPDVSRLLRGDFREYSLERLFRLHDPARPRHRHPHPPAALGHRREAAHRAKRDRLTRPSRCRQSGRRLSSQGREYPVSEDVNRRHYHRPSITSALVTKAQGCLGQRLCHGPPLHRSMNRRP